MELRVVAIAVASGRMGYVCLIGDRLMDWRLVGKATASPAAAADIAQTWLTQLKPDVVITEQTDTATTKGQKTKAIIEAVARVAAHHRGLDVAVQRERVYRNKYAEAAALTKLFPELRPWLPHQRRCWENEPRQTVLFEALAMSLQVRQGSVVDLARAIENCQKSLYIIWLWLTLNTEHKQNG